MDSAGAARWIKRAETLARSIRDAYGTKREIHDGYIVEGRRTPTGRSARVIDVPGVVCVVGASQPISEDVVSRHPEAPLGGILRYAGYAARRAALVERVDSEAPPPALGDIKGSWRVGYGDLLRRNPLEATASDLNDAFTHGVIERDDGWRVVGTTRATPAIVGGVEALLEYRRPGDSTFYLFQFGMIRGGSVGFGEAEISGPAALGLRIDSDWIEDFLGGGARLLLDGVPSGGSYTSPLGSYYYDSHAKRWSAPWVVAHPVTIEPRRVQWRVTTRFGGAPVNGDDYYGEWRVATFLVDVEVDDTAIVTATPHPPDIYNPSPARQRTTTFGYFGINLFGFPAVATDGALMIPHVVGHDDGGTPLVVSTHHEVVLLTPEGQFVEITGLPTSVSSEMGSALAYGKTKTIFFGGDQGVMVNPFVDVGTIALVDTTTGAVSLIPRPTLQIPLSLTLAINQQQNRFYITDDLCKNMVGRLRDRVLCFPAQTYSESIDDDDDGYINPENYANVVLVSLDIDTHEVNILGAMFDSANTNRIAGGIAKPCAVRYEQVDPDTGEVLAPAVLLWGVHSYRYEAATIVGGEIVGVVVEVEDGSAGWTYISYDSGYTWHRMSDMVGPARAVWYAGSPLHSPPPGGL